MKREAARGGASARNIKRRTFIKTGAAAVAGAATLSGIAGAAEPAEAPAETGQTEETEPAA